MGNCLPSQLTFDFAVNDTNKQFYQQLPFTAIGKTQETSVLERLDKKSMDFIDVE